MYSDFFIQLGIQSVLGLIAVALNNPNSSSFRKFRPALRTLRDGLAGIPLDDPPPVSDHATDFADVPRRRATD